MEGIPNCRNRVDIFISDMPECAVCSSFTLLKCKACESVFYCSLAHQREDWKAHKLQCPTLAQESLLTTLGPSSEKLLLTITSCLARGGYNSEVLIMVQLNRAFWWDAQIWDAFKDVDMGGGMTRLMVASGSGALNRVNWLLSRGARVDAAMFDGLTPLMSASMMGHLKVVCALCRKGADVNAMRAEGGINGETALIFASKDGNLELVQKLCEWGANVNAAHTASGYTALMHASQSGHFFVARLLLKLGAIKSTRAHDGKNAFSLASGRSKGILRTLLKP